MLRVVILVLAALAWMSPSGASAQGKYPTKPIEIIVPFAAGASHEAGARA